MCLEVYKYCMYVIAPNEARSENDIVILNIQTSNSSVSQSICADYDLFVVDIHDYFLHIHTSQIQ